MNRAGLYRSLQVEFGSRILAPGTQQYEQFRRVWNGMHDRRPAFIARCLSASDVSHILRYATAVGETVTVRGGSHNVAGSAVADDVIMIDLSLMRAVSVSPARMIAQAEGGCLLRDVDAATARYGLACPVGVVSHTGLGGLALGGGYGWLARKWGLTCDHIEDAEVVLADGSIVRAVGVGHDDLLWALRGGGGNFGVVTRFSLRLRPAGKVLHHVAVYGQDRVRDALIRYGEFAPSQPTDLHTVGALKIVGHQPWIPGALVGSRALFLTTVWLGNPSRGRAAISRFDEVPAAAARTRSMTYLELQALGDYSEPHGNRYFTKSCYLRELSPGTAEKFLTAAHEMPSARSSIDFEYLRGAIENIPPAASAFPRRAAPYIFTAAAQWIDPADDAVNTSWAKSSVERLADVQYGGSYINYVQESGGAERSAEIYGVERYQALAGIKGRYDPDNVLVGSLQRPDNDRAVPEPAEEEGVQ
jgi:FAD/FMN-containing dehydrogenase